MVTLVVFTFVNNVWMMKIIFIPFGIENMEWHKSNTWTLKELTYALAYILLKKTVVSVWPDLVPG